MALVSILVDVVARTASIEEALTRVEGRLNSFGTAVNALGGILSVGAIAHFADQMLEMGHNIEHASERLGISTTAFQELSFAAKQSGVGMDELSTAMIRMERMISLASTGNKQASTTLSALGLSFKQLEGLKPEEQFEVIADRISKLASTSDHARAMIDAFGRSGGMLGAMIAKGAEGIITARENAERFGQVLDDITVKKLSEAAKATETMGGAFKTLGAAIMGVAAGPMKEFADQMTVLLTGDERLKAQLRLSQDVAKYNEMLERYQKPGASLLNLFGRPSAQDLAAQENEVRKSQARVDELNRIAEDARAAARKASDAAALEAKTPPGYGASDLNAILPGVHPTLRKMSGGLDALLIQWGLKGPGGEDPVRLYEQTIARIEEMRAPRMKMPHVEDFPTLTAYLSAYREALQKKELGPGLITDEQAEELAKDAKLKLQVKLDQILPSVEVGHVNIRMDKILDFSEAEVAVHGFTSDFKQALDLALHETGNFGDNFVKAMLQAFENRLIFRAVETLGAYIANTLSSSLEGEGGGGLLGSLFTWAFGSGSGTIMGRQSGGFVRGGQSYLVGEHGPEMFTPGASGNITPSEKLGGPSVVINTYMDNRGATTDFIAAMPSILKSNNDQLEARIIKGLQRRKYALA